MSDLKVFFMILTAALVTQLTRFTPFVLFQKRKTPEFVAYLGKTLPHAIMGMLVIFCLKNIRFTSASAFLPELIAAAATAGLHYLKRNTLLSIVGGTVIYMLLIRFVF